MPTLISGSTGVNKITDGTIVNADINSSAAIAGSKLVMPTGSVLQVVSGTSTANTSTASTSYVATDLSATITPTSTSSKIYIMVTGFMQVNPSQIHGYITMYRDSTDLGGNQGFGNWYSDSGGYSEYFCSASHLDSPSSTSAITYKVYVKSGSSSGTAGFGNPGRKHTMTLMEIAG